MPDQPDPITTDPGTGATPDPVRKESMSDTVSFSEYQKAVAAPSLLEQARKAREAKGSRRQRLASLAKKMQSRYNDTNKSLSESSRTYQSASERQREAAKMAENASVYDRRRWLDEERIWASKSYQYNQKVQKATRSKQRLEARAPVIGSALVAARAKAKARAAAKAKA